MKAYLDVNRALWDGWTKLHAISAFYDVDGFKAGRSTLKGVEREALGDVTGQTLLHLQCHFGLDTMSWAREGALVTGVDFSPEAMILARSLRDEMHLAANFICADIYDLPEILEEQFDIVYTSYGVLAWLPDLDRWAQVVAHFLKPGGTFYIVEFHPLLAMFDKTGEHVAYPYFHSPEPIRIEESGSYADTDDDTVRDSYEWAYPLGDIVTALLKAGLKLEYLREFPYSTYPYPSYVEEEAPERYVWEKQSHAFPLMFSIKATR